MTPRAAHQRAPQQEQLLGRADQLYEQFAKPLEAEHEGEFIAIAKEGRIVLGRTAREAGRQARNAFGPENFVFKIGPRVVAKLAGVWSDLDWDEAERDLDPIRHESQPTPLVTLDPKDETSSK